MGIPLAYSELFLPKLLIHFLSLLTLTNSITTSLFRLLGLPHFLEPDPFPHHNLTRPDRPPISSVLIRELLPTIKFEDIINPTRSENCAVCLNDFVAGDEIRWLWNCKHVFHRSCLDRWMDHDQMTCPLCRTSLVPRDLEDEFNQRLWAAFDVEDHCSEYNFVSEF